MKLTNKNLQEDGIEELVISLGEFILSKQASDGSIPSNEDGTHDRQWLKNNNALLSRDKPHDCFVCFCELDLNVYRC